MFLRSDKSIIAKWWWNIDGFILLSVIVLMTLGVVLSFSASPAVADKIGQEPYFFVKKHLLFLPLSLAVIFGASLLNLKQIRLLSLVVFFGSIVLMIAVLFAGVEVKGATRWIEILGFSIQPSEFMKPAFIVMVGWAFSHRFVQDDFLGIKIGIAFFVIAISLLLLQPDIGMTIVLAVTWGAQFFMAGISIAFMLLLLGAGVLALVISYFSFPHVRTRIDTFLYPETGDTYQVTTALKAFNNGRFFGQGPGEGSVKYNIPDVHTDFILTVAAEEFGLVLCLFIIAIYGFIVIYSLKKASKSDSLFIIITVTGLCVQFGLQALINIGATINVIPTKGMTLPFVSYGGSSLLAISLGVGILLALTKKTNEEL